MMRSDFPDDVRLIDLKLEDGPYRDSRLDLIKLREMVDVEVVTNINYTHVAHGHLVNVEFRFCDQMNMDVQGLGGLGLYRYNKEWINVDDYEERNDNLPGPYHYHTAFSSFAHDKEPDIFGEQAILDYDLRELPRDICFRVKMNAGYDLMGHRSSNVVRIPKEMLTKFFAEHPRRAPPPN